MPDKALYPRFAEPRPTETLADSPIVLIHGPRQCGKTTLALDGGKRIAAALGNKKFCILRNHGLLTVGRSVEESIGWFVMAERVAEVHVKAPNGRPISDEASAAAASTLALDPVGWRMFQWLQRSLVPDRSVVD